MTFDKDTYRKNREAGIRGQGAKPVPTPAKLSGEDIPKGAEISFDEHGHILIKNRAYRRQRTLLPGEQSGSKKPKLNKDKLKLFRKKGRK